VVGCHIKVFRVNVAWWATTTPAGVGGGGGVGEAVARKMTRGAVVEMGGHMATNGQSHGSHVIFLL
jgi:hypothetical protein